MMFRGKTVAIIVVVTMLFTSLVTFSIGGFIDVFRSGEESASDSGEFNTQKIEEAYALIKSRYIHSAKDQQLLDGAIKGMIESLEDPYSSYMDKEQAKKFMSDLKSSFSGIGAEVTQRDGKIVIVSPLEDSPAEKSGLKPNDEIVKINDKSTENYSLNQAVEQIRGPKGTKVNLEIKRPGNQDVFAISVVRDDIKQETVDAKLFPEKTGYIKISQFSEGTSKDFLQTLRDYESKGMTGLVIDVRGNPGGLLTSVQEILEEFIPEGEPIMRTEERGEKQETFYGKAQKKKDYPIAVLIDNGSASASEILAAGLKEGNGSMVIGEQSFGKGTVQTAVDFKDGSNIKLTMAKWLTPKGNWIDQHGGSGGVKPTVPVKYPDYAKVVPPQPEQPLKMDMNSDQVKNMQIILDAMGYTLDRKDGYFDQHTKTAVESFQRTQQMDISGVLDAKTASKLQEEFIKFLRDPDQDIQLQVALSRINDQ